MARGSQPLNCPFATFVDCFYTQFACISLLSRLAFEMLFDSAFTQDCWVLRSGHAAPDDAWLSCKLTLPTTLMRMRTVISSQNILR